MKIRCWVAASIAAVVAAVSLAVVPAALAQGAGGAAGNTDRPEGAPLEPGAAVRLYDTGEAPEAMPELVKGQTANVNTVVPAVSFDNTAKEGIFGFRTRFLMLISGFIRIEKEGVYTFRLESDDGSMLYVDGEQVINNDGLHALLAADKTLELKAGDHPFFIRYYQGDGEGKLSFEWKPPGATGFALVPAGTLVTPAGEVRVTAPGRKRIVNAAQSGRPGDLQPVAGVHPSYALSRARPDGFQPKVGGIDFLSDGRMVVCTWDPEGAVYVLGNVVGNSDPEAITVKKFAQGLAEPLGLKVVQGKGKDGDRVFVLQKQELTELIDTDKDGEADFYRTVASGWPVSANFHEFAFGLLEKGGKFYFNLAIAINAGGSSTKPQVPNRGSVIEVDAETGTWTPIAHGLRTPNGIGFGVDGEIFVSDNQGDWLPVSKVLHVDLARTKGEEQQFYGSRAVLLEGAEKLPVTLPVVWLPQGEIGNSPSQIAALHDGPYQNQMLVGDVTYGGLQRVFAEKVAGRYQGVVFKFAQGFEAGVNRVVKGPDGAYYVGGIGSSGNWGQEGKKRYGLERIAYNGKPTFEMLAVRAKSNGFEIEFTAPLAAGLGWDPGEYQVEQWEYVPTVNYGGPKVNPEKLAVASATVSEDRKRVFLEVEGIRENRCVYLRLTGDFWSPEVKGQTLWTTEAWYTMNSIPKDLYGTAAKPPAGVVRANELTAEEKAQGWTLLFDGKTLAGWRGFKQDRVPEGGWDVVNGAIVRTESVGDIVTDKEYENFELAFDWMVTPGANSGVFYMVSEDPRYNAVWETGPEFQVLDNAAHADGKNPLTSAGASYALYQPASDASHPVGAYNRARIKVQGGRVEHWLNGQKIVEYTLGSPEWKERVAGSKFKAMPGYGMFRKGRIALQDHGDVVRYRNIKIRELPAAGAQ